MAEIDKAIEMESETPETEEVDVELESSEEEAPSMDQAISAEEEFYKNLGGNKIEKVIEKMIGKSSKWNFDQCSTNLGREKKSPPSE